MNEYPKIKLQIDEEGYLMSAGVRIADVEYGRELLKNLVVDERGRFRTRDGTQSVAIEAFDEPLIVRLLERKADRLIGHFPYEWTDAIDLDSFSVDEWDRFHGRNARGVPYVLARPAQAALFDLVDEFDDESLTFFGRHFPPPWLRPFGESDQSDFWTKIYREGSGGWELGRENPIFPALLPQLNLSRQRVAVLGCGQGHDAAFFARAGHLVTGIDFSEAAIELARSNYGDLRDLRFLKADIFNLPANLKGNFDVVVEHTCYCAINPERRNELVQVWRSLLNDQGHLLGIFFVMDKQSGPPWGGSEWEIRERLKKSFNFLYWTRWNASIEKRQGNELVIWSKIR